MRPINYFIIAVLTFAFATCPASAQRSKDYLRRIFDTAHHYCGYVNARGDTVIPFQKYFVCYTPRFEKFAIVGATDKGLVGIDRNENVLFKVYIFDNGPDEPSNGLFRIVKDEKIGYANLDGEIVIAPKFDCAYPFERGKAKVGIGCKTETDGGHSWWTGGEWYTIDRKGKVIKR